LDGGWEKTSSFRAWVCVDPGEVKGCEKWCTPGVGDCTGIVVSPLMTLCWCSRSRDVCSIICCVVEDVWERVAGILVAVGEIIDVFITPTGVSGEVATDP